MGNAKAFIEFPQTIDDVYGNFEDYNLTKKSKMLIVFDDMIVDSESYKKISPIIIELIGLITIVSLIFVSQSHFKPLLYHENT